ncbi:MAG TPA: hypothetical protein VIG30_05045 [Ktedonobacterales bacterium]
MKLIAFQALLSNPQSVARVRALTRDIERVGGIGRDPGLHEGGPNVERLMEWIRQLSARRGVDFVNSTRVPDFMRQAGLANVRGSVVKVPTGTYGGRVGALVATDFVSISKGYGGLIVNSGLTTADEFAATIEGMRLEFEAPDLRCYTPFYIAIGQRPA